MLGDPIILYNFEYPIKAPLFHHLPSRYPLHLFLLFNMSDPLHGEAAVNIDLSFVLSTLLLHIYHAVVVFQDYLLVGYERTLRLFGLLIINVVILSLIRYWILAHKLSATLS